LHLSDLTLFPVKARSHSDQVFYLSGPQQKLFCVVLGAHPAQIFIDQEQTVAAVADQRQFIQHGFEQLLFFVLLGNIPLQEIEGGVIL